MITQRRLREILVYHPRSGVFRWKATIAARAQAGQRAGSLSAHGKKIYRKIRIDHVLYYEHRLAWLYMKGVWPDPECDHRDLDGTNNRWSNLRQADKSQNQCNIPVGASNTSGEKGVVLRRDTMRYTATIVARGKSHALGCFDTIEEAAAARLTAAKRLHGEFAR